MWERAIMKNMKKVWNILLQHWICVLTFFNFVPLVSPPKVEDTTLVLRVQPEAPQESFSCGTDSEGACSIYLLFHPNIQHRRNWALNSLVYCPIRPSKSLVQIYPHSNHLYPSLSTLVWIPGVQIPGVVIPVQPHLHNYSPKMMKLTLPISIMTWYRDILEKGAVIWIITFYQSN